MSVVASVARAPRTAPRPAPRRPVLRVVPAAIERSHAGVFAMICIGLLVGGLVGLLVLHAQLATGTYTVHELERRSGALADEKHELTKSLDAERNPASLARKAVALGMVPAQSMAFIRLTDGQIIGVAEPAKGDKPVTIIDVARPGGAPVAPPAVTPPAPAR